MLPALDPTLRRGSGGTMQPSTHAVHFPAATKHPRRACMPPPLQQQLRPSLARTARVNASREGEAGHHNSSCSHHAGGGSPAPGGQKLPAPVPGGDLPVVVPAVLDEEGVRQHESNLHIRRHQQVYVGTASHGGQGGDPAQGLGGQRHHQGGVGPPLSQEPSRQGGTEDAARATGRPEEAGGAFTSKLPAESGGPCPGPPPASLARWPALVLLLAAVWGAAWSATVGLLSASYAALAAAAAAAAAAFGSLAPGAVAVPAGSANAAAAAAASVASVDWVEVALRTAGGLAADDGGAGRAQVLAALQDADASGPTSWAVVTLLPVLCTLAGSCGAAADAVQAGLPWLGPLAQLSAAAAGLGVLLLLAMPLRRFLAPLLPVLPRGGPSSSTLVPLRAGGALCMTAVLTSLQTHELTAPPLAPSARGAAAAAALASPLLQQTQAVLYGAVAAASDAVLPACTAVVAARAALVLLRQRPKDVLGKGDTPSAFTLAVKVLAAARLLLDVLVLLAVGAGVMPGKISAVRLLGMLWMLQTAALL